MAYMIFLVSDDGKHVPYGVSSHAGPTFLLNTSQSNNRCEVLARHLTFDGDVEEKRLVWKNDNPQINQTFIPAIKEGWNEGK